MKSRLNERGHEVLDPKPVSISLKPARASEADRVLDILHSQRVQMYMHAMSLQPDVMDFEPESDMPPPTKYEMAVDVEASVKRRRKSKPAEQAKAPLGAAAEPQSGSPPREGQTAASPPASDKPSNG